MSHMFGLYASTMLVVMLYPLYLALLAHTLVCTQAHIIPRRPILRIIHTSYDLLTRDR